MISEIGRRTRLKNRDVQAMLEALVEVWTEELVSDGRIELENFFVLETQKVERAANCLLPARHFRRVTVRGSKSLRKKLKFSNETIDER